MIYFYNNLLLNRVAELIDDMNNNKKNMFGIDSGAANILRLCLITNRIPYSSFRSISPHKYSKKSL